MNTHTVSLVLVYAVIGAPTFTDALACAAVLPYAEYSPVDDPIRALFDKWTGNPISPRTLAAMGLRGELRRMDKRAVEFDAEDILLDAVAAGDVELIEWSLKEFELEGQRLALTTWGPAAEQYCTVAARNGRLEFLAWWWPQLLPHDLNTYQAVVDRIFNAAADLSVLQWLEAMALAEPPLILLLPKANLNVVCQMAETGDVAAMDWLIDHGVESMAANDWLRVAVRASAKGRGAVLDWIWDHHGTLLAAATFKPKDQEAMLVDASVRGDLATLAWWLSKYRLHPQLFEFTLLGQRKVLAAAARNNQIPCLEWWLERADGNVHVTGRTKAVRKNRPATGIVFPLKSGWFGADWGEGASVPVLEWWHAKCAEYGEPWAPLYLSPLALTGSTDVLDWAWDHGSRWLDVESVSRADNSWHTNHTSSAPSYGIYSVAIAAAERGNTHVLDWLWQKSLFLEADLKKTVWRAALKASMHNHVPVLEWYLAKFAIHDPSFRWRFPPRKLLFTLRNGHAPIAKWWYQHSPAYVRAQHYWSFLHQPGQVASVETLEWVVAGPVGKSSNVGCRALTMLLAAPTVGAAWFWVRLCVMYPGQVHLPYLFLVDATATRLLHLELVRRICLQRGWDATNQLRGAVGCLKRTEARVRWWQTHFGSPL